MYCFYDTGISALNIYNSAIAPEEEKELVAMNTWLPLDDDDKN